SQLVVVVQKDSKYAKEKSLADLSGAKITAQLNTFHYTVIEQIPDVQKQQAMDNFSAMRTALASGTIDGYVSERPEGVT
ncbi:amino acid ABC transporter permease, partial [Enterococcus faecium]